MQAYARTKLVNTPNDLDRIDSFLQRIKSLDVPNSIRNEMAIAAGVYVGEMLINNVGGKWIKPSQQSMRRIYKVAWVVELTNGTIANPILKAEKIALRFDGEANSLTPFWVWATTGSRT